MSNRDITRTIIALSLLGCWCSPAQASRIQCDEDWLAPTDEHELARAVSSAAPAGVRFDAERKYCRRWTPKYAYASLESGHRAGPDEIEEWWSIGCRRRIAWTCDRAIRNRRMTITHTIAGAPHHVTIEFDEDTPVARAAAVTRATIIALWTDTTSSSPLECALGPDIEKEDRAGWEEMQKSARASLLDTPMQVEVTSNANGTQVFLPSRFGPYLKFIAAAAGSEPRLECWANVIVTS